MSNTLRLYVADLAEYNAGRLHGRWIDVNGMDEEDLAAEIAASVKLNPHSDGERNEHAFHDHEGFGNLIGEYTGVSRIVELIEIADELGDDWPLYVAYAESLGSDDVSADDFKDAYVGSFDSFRDYAIQTFDEVYGSQVPDFLSAYIDYDAYARDLEADMTVIRVSGDFQAHVFHSH